MIEFIYIVFHMKSNQAHQNTFSSSALPSSHFTLCHFHLLLLTSRINALFIAFPLYFTQNFQYFLESTSSSTGTTWTTTWLSEKSTTKATWISWINRKGRGKISLERGRNQKGFLTVSPSEFIPLKHLLPKKINLTFIESKRRIYNK